MLIELNEEAVNLIEELQERSMIMGDIGEKEWTDKMIKLNGIVTSKYLQEKIRIMATLECVQ